MALTYELWNTRSGNRFGEYDSEDDAILAVRAMLEAHGQEVAEMLELSSEDEEGEEEILLRGAALVERARPPAKVKRTIGGSGSGSSGSRLLGAAGFGIANYEPFGGYDFSTLAFKPFSGIDFNAWTKPLGDLGNGVFGVKSLTGFDPNAFSASGAMSRMASDLTSTFTIAPLIPSIANGIFVSETVTKSLLSINTFDWSEHFSEHYQGLGEIISGAAAPQISPLSPQWGGLWRIAGEAASQTTEVTGIGDYVIASRLAPEVVFIYHQSEDVGYLALVAEKDDADQGDNVVLLPLGRVKEGKLAG